MLYAMSDAVTVGLIVFVGGIAATASPIILAHLTNKAAIQARELEWEREDEVAARAQAAVDDLARTQKALISASTVTYAKLTEVHKQNRIIHALVNSAYTASLEATRVALVGQLKALERAAGDQPAERDAIAIKAIQVQIDALEVTIADRLAAEQHADLEARTIANADAADVPSFIVEAPVQIPVFPPPPPPPPPQES